MAGPYTFEKDRDAGTWRCLNNSGSEIATGDLPLDSLDRLEAIFSDYGVSDPTASALLDYHRSNWDDQDL